MKTRDSDHTLWIRLARLHAHGGDTSGAETETVALTEQHSS